MSLATSSSVASAPAELAQAFLPNLLESLSSNVKVVGGAWMLSSALLTTYSTTRFLKYQHGNTASTTNPGTPIKALQKVKENTPKHHSPLWLFLHLPRPVLLTLYRFGGSLLLGLLLHPNFQLIQRVRDTVAVIPDFALPAAFLFLANFTNSIALNRIGISLTYTTKCAIPIFTVILTFFLDGASALPSIPTLLSLVPIATGIAMASWDSPVFETKGFGFAMVSSSAQTALNVCSKKAMAKTGLSGTDGQRAMVAFGLVIAIATTLLLNNNSNGDDPETRRPPPGWLSLMALSAYHVEYVLSFNFVKLVAPIAYGASDAVRRLAIIISGHYMFGHDSFTRINILGIATALLGALCYAITSHAV